MTPSITRARSRALITKRRRDSQLLQAHREALIATFAALSEPEPWWVYTLPFIVVGAVILIARTVFH
jgi:hypothetical protein